MIELYFAPTPNGWKVSIMLEECGMPYDVKLVNLAAGEQFSSEFLAISPNNKIPVIVDTKPDDGGEPMSVFESGAVLIYLAEKSGKFFPSTLREQYQIIQWLFWQVGNLGPMAGQLSHFVNYTEQEHTYSLQRYQNEYDRLAAVLDKQLDGRVYIADEFSIADIASFPWFIPYKQLGLNMDQYKNLRRWFDTMKNRPGVRRGVDLGKDIAKSQAQGKTKIDEKTRKILFQQSGESFKKN